MSRFTIAAAQSRSICRGLGRGAALPERVLDSNTLNRLARIQFLVVDDHAAARRRASDAVDLLLFRAVTGFA